MLFTRRCSGKSLDLGDVAYAPDQAIETLRKVVGPADGRSPFMHVDS
jgi:hypothetical protein